jgi:hypothetical protein
MAKYHRVSFDWNETYDSPMKFIEIIKKLGFIVYDRVGSGPTFVDYIISKKPIKKYKGKEL